MTKKEKHDNYNKLLADFMLITGKHGDFLTDEQWWTAHRLGNGVEGLYEIPADKWEKEWADDHIFNSSLLAKKKMADYILDLVSAFGLKEIKEPRVLEPIK